MTSVAQASVLEQFDAPLQLREFPIPARIEPGAALVRTEMAGICGTDVHLWKGQLPIALPVIMAMKPSDVSSNWVKGWNAIGPASPSNQAIA